MNNPQNIKNYWLHEKKIIILITITGIIYNTSMVARPIYEGKLIDALVNKVDFYELVKLTITFILFICLVQISRYFKRYYVREFANKTTKTMRMILYENLLSKDERKLKEEDMGTLMTKSIKDINTCVESMRKCTTEVFDTAVLSISYLVTLLSYDIKITLYACSFIPLALIVAHKLKKLVFKHTKQYTTQLSKVSNLTYDNINNALLYRLYSREEDNKTLFEEELQNLQQKSIKANAWVNATKPMYNLISMTAIIFVIIMMGQGVYENRFSIGDFCVYVSIFNVLAAKSSRIANLFNVAQKGEVSWRRIKPYLKNADKKDKTSCKPSKNTSLQIKNMSFRYNEEYILQNFSLDAKDGEIIGITGKIGCGKSSFGKIFLGLYDYEGSVSIDNKELEYYTYYQKSEIISYLGHNPHLISDTIKNNITLGENKDIYEVLDIVSFKEDLSCMKQNYNTIVGDSGIRLSGGQQMRIALARTLYHKKKIIILDDPFCSVDKKTEEKIMKKLKNYCKDSILIIISHRLTVFPDLDKIILIENKNMTCDTHQNLIKNSSLYRELYLLQDTREGDYNV